MSLSNRRTFIAKLIGYFVLVGAAILTMIPLLWLVTSSFKTASEIFAVPLKWFPEFPPNVKASPYIDQDAYPPIKKPEALHQRGWEKLQPQISSLIWEEAQKYIAASDRMRSYDRALNVELQAEMVQGIWKQLIVGLSDRVWSGSTTEILSTIRSAIIPEAIDGIWDSLYREVALGSIQIQDMDFNQISLGKPKWSREVEDVTSVREYSGANNGTGFSHHFDGQNKVRIVTSIQSPLPIDRMRAIHLRVRGDASYHHLRLTIEAGDVVYRSREPFVLNDSLWGHSIWRIHGAPSQLESDHIAMIREVKANRIGGATDASEGSELAPLEPSNTLRLRLEIYRPPYLAIFS